MRQPLFSCQPLPPVALFLIPFHTINGRKRWHAQWEICRRWYNCAALNIGVLTKVFCYKPLKNMQSWCNCLTSQEGIYQPKPHWRLFLKFCLMIYIMFYHKASYIPHLPLSCCKNQAHLNSIMMLLLTVQGLWDYTTEKLFFLFCSPPYKEAQTNSFHVLKVTYTTYKFTNSVAIVTNLIWSSQLQKNV